MLSFIKKAFVSFSALSYFSTHYKLTFSHRSPHYNANLNHFFFKLHIHYEKLKALFLVMFISPIFQVRKFFFSVYH